jgi:hypothetical protein
MDDRGSTLQELPTEGWVAGYERATWGEGVEGWWASSDSSGYEGEATRELPGIHCVQGSLEVVQGGRFEPECGTGVASIQVSPRSLITRAGPESRLACTFEGRLI